MGKLHYLIILLTLNVSLINVAHSHAEHDKARYVALSGNDVGDCDTPSAPCRSVGYAAKKANKGDKILVAQGAYQIKNVDELFYLTSELIPSYGGYSQNDHYKSSDPSLHPTYISGVPGQYAAQLKARGFIVIADKKSKSLAESSAFQQKVSQFDAIKQAQTDQPCINGFADSFPCNKVDLLAHVPLSQFSGSPSAANDIWGHVDLNTGIEYAIIGLRNGVSVVSLATPSAPTVVGHVDGHTAIWRDIKVYQFFDDTIGQWQSYAYVSTDGAADSIAIIDLNKLPNSISKVAHANEDTSLHNIYISNVNYGTGVAINHRQPLLHSMGSNRYGGAHRSYDLIHPTAPTSVYVPSDATRDDYTHDGTSFVVTDDRVANDCQRLPTNIEPSECDVFVDFNENEMRLWDQTDKTTLTELGKGIYTDAAYTHSGWWTEDKKVVYVHDELDEQTHNSNTALIIFEVSDLTAPNYKGRWLGPTRAIDHNGFVRGNRYYMSNYERGMTILDITNPLTPVEIGYFDTFPFSDDDQFNGAWGVYPFLPSGLILVSDINSGLYVLRDQTKQVAQGQLSFDTNHQLIVEGDTATITVKRVGNAVGSVSVDYQTLWGSATADDFVATTGTLTWANGDLADKTINVETLIDSNHLEFTEQFALELFNPQGGVTLATPGSAWVSIAGNDETSGLKFAADSMTVLENETGDTTQVFVPVSRFPSFDQAVTANVSIVNASAGATATTSAEQNLDYILENTVLSWPANDRTDKFIELTILNDTLNEATETIVITLEASDNYRRLGPNEFVINLLDDDANQAPVISSQNLSSYLGEHNLQSLVTVTDDQPGLSYQWQLTSNTDHASIINASNANAVLITTAPGLFDIALSVTDPFGETTTSTLQVEIKQGIDDEGENKKSGWLSLNYLSIVFTTALLLVRRRKTAQTISK